MKLYVVCVRDRATDSFGRPFFVPHVGEALRSFTDEVNNKDSELGRHPEDYDLFQCGTFDSDTGLFDCGTPRQMAIGKDLVKGV